MRTLQAGKADHFFKDAAFALNGINQPAAHGPVPALTNLLLTPAGL
jgi:hypothetical protein